MIAYSPHQFALVRLLLGGYLFFLLLALLPYSTELFSSTGFFSSSFQPFVFSPYLDPLLQLAAEPLVIFIIHCSLIGLSLLFFLGVWRRLVALGLWLGWLLLANLNPFSIDPSLAFTGLLLLIYVVAPAGEPWRWRRAAKPNWHLPPLLFWGAWLIFTLSFTISGYEKFQSELWREGMAVYYFHSGVISIDTIISRIFNSIPVLFGMTLTWIILYSQLFALFAVVTEWTRITFWFCTFSLFVGSLFVLDLFAVIVAMLIFYIFVFDSRWFSRSADATVYIDVECPACSYFAKFLKTENRNGTLVVSHFADSTLANYLTPVEIKRMKEMIYVENGSVYRGADAIIMSVSGLGGVWSTILVLKLIPKSLRDYGYRLLSTYRKQLLFIH